MRKIIKFLSKNYFNRIDIFGIITSVILITEEKYWYGFFALLIGTFLASLVEVIDKEYYS